MGCGGLGRKCDDVGGGLPCDSLGKEFAGFCAEVSVGAADELSAVFVSEPGCDDVGRDVLFDAVGGEVVAHFVVGKDGQSQTSAAVGEGDFGALGGEQEGVGRGVGLACARFV